MKRSLATTGTNLVLMLLEFLEDPARNSTLLAADVIIMIITVYLLLAGVRELLRDRRRPKPTRQAEAS